MCGILASVNSTEWIENKNLYHRGPDRCFKFNDKSLKVHFYRLAIIGNDHDGSQPFSDLSKRFNVWCNGEIFNYKELSLKYKIVLKTTCDIEVIPKLISKIGIKKTLSQIRGFFSMIIYDKNKKEIYLSVDHFGIKPLYYSLQNNKLLISSELRSFEKSKLNFLAIKQYFETLSSISSNTFLDNVFSLEPSQIIKFDISNNIKKVNSSNYWNLEIDKIEKFPINKDEINYKITQAFQRNSISDFPVSNLLSGGIDSTIIAL